MASWNHKDLGWSCRYSYILHSEGAGIILWRSHVYPVWCLLVSGGGQSRARGNNNQYCNIAISLSTIRSSCYYVFPCSSPVKLKYPFFVVCFHPLYHLIILCLTTPTFLRFERNSSCWVNQIVNVAVCSYYRAFEGSIPFTKEINKITLLRSIINYSKNEKNSHK